MSYYNMVVRVVQIKMGHMPHFILNHQFPFELILQEYAILAYR